MCAPGDRGIGRLTAGLLALTLPVAAQEPLEGRWIAEARLGPEAMTLVLDVERRDGALDARISVPAERVLGLRLEGFVWVDGEVAFRIPHPDHPMDFAGLLGVAGAMTPVPGGTGPVTALVLARNTVAAGFAALGGSLDHVELPLVGLPC